MSSVTTLASAVGSFLTDFRKEHNLTLDQIARTAREFGVSWSASSVRNIESGKAVISLPNLLALSLSLVELTGAEIRLVELFGNPEGYLVPSFKGRPLSREWLGRILAGDPVVVGYSDVVDRDAYAAEREAEMLDYADAFKLDHELFGPPTDSASMHESIDRLGSYREVSLAEERAAARLKITPPVLKVWATYLWQNTLEEEATKRAKELAAKNGKPLTAQLRGSMTRQLIVELRRAIDLHRGPHGSPA